MNSEQKKRISGVLITFLLLACIIPSVAAAFTPDNDKQYEGRHKHGHHRPVLGIWKDSNVIKKIGLTEDQIKQIRDVDFTFREARLTLKAQLDRHHLEMEKAFTDEVVNEQVVLQTANKISNLKGKLYVQKVEARLALGKIMDENQIKMIGLYEFQSKKKGQKKAKKSIARQKNEKIR